MMPHADGKVGVTLTILAIRLNENRMVQVLTVEDQQVAKADSSPVRSQFDVIYALMLHDIKSRYFGNGLGYVVTILWPAVHVVILVSIFLLTGRSIPFGDSPIIYVATGVLPYVAWNYISRFTQIASLANRSYMAYPIIRFLDILFARIILEIVSITIITAGMILLIPLFGGNTIPVDPRNALFALLASIYLGIGFGVLAAVITRVFPLFVIVYILFLIVFWITGGVAVNPEAMPREIGDIIAYNPLLHCIEWMRKAYFPDAPTRLLSKSYLLVVATSALTLGLIGERILRPFFK